MKSICLVLLFALTAFATSALAADAEAGKAKSAVCVACHGPAGVSSNPCGLIWQASKTST